MTCPKCKAHIGIHYQERYLQSISNAQGISCLICGLWVNGRMQDTASALNMANQSYPI